MHENSTRPARDQRPPAVRHIACGLGLTLAVAGCTSGGDDAASAGADAAQAPITVTFVRHAESFANAGGVVTASVPGTLLTDDGHAQAETVADELSSHDHDAVYSSGMTRTEQTAQYLADSLDLEVEILDGIHEVELSLLDGQSEEESGEIILEVASRWLHGDSEARVTDVLGAEVDDLSTVNADPGESGAEFVERFEETLTQVYEDGNERPVVFSHGLTIMVGSLLMDDSLDPDEISLADSAISSTGTVTLEGSPAEGWTVVEWMGADGPE